MVATIAQKLASDMKGGEPEAEPEPEPNGEGEDEGMAAYEEDEAGAMMANAFKGSSKKIKAQIQAMVNQAIRRERVAGKLRANASSTLTEEDLSTLSVDALEKFEQAIRPADYSGQAGFAANSAVPAGDPLTPRGVFDQ